MFKTTNGRKGRGLFFWAKANRKQRKHGGHYVNKISNQSPKYTIAFRGWPWDNSIVAARKGYPSLVREGRQPTITPEMT